MFFTFTLINIQNIMISIEDKLFYIILMGDKMQKKGIFILLFLIIGFCALSTASAADDVDALSADDAIFEEISTDLDDNEEANLEESSEGENLAVSEDSSTLSTDTSDEVVSVVYST